MNSPSSLSAFLTKIQLLYDLHRYADAENLALEYIAANPESAIGYLQLAIAASLQPGMEQKGLDAVRRAIALDPNGAHAYYTLARLLMQTGPKNYKAAFHAIGEALRLRPESANYIAELGSMYLQTRKNKQAFETALQGLRIDPRHVECANVQAAALINLGRSAEARQVLADVLSIDPLDASAHYNAGRMLLNAGEIDLARVHFVEALRQQPKWEPPRKALVQSLKSRDWLYTHGNRLIVWLARHWWITLPALLALSALVAWGFSLAQPEALDFELLVMGFLPFTLLSGLYVFFAFYSMFIDARLRFDPYGRMVMSLDEIYAANLTLATAVAVLPGLLVGILTSSPYYGVFCWAVLVTIAVPVLKVMKTSQEKRRR